MLVVFLFVCIGSVVIHILSKASIFEKTTFEVNIQFFYLILYLWSGKQLPNIFCIPLKFVVYLIFYLEVL